MSNAAATPFVSIELGHTSRFHVAAVSTQTFLARSSGSVFWMFPTARPVGFSELRLPGSSRIVSSESCAISGWPEPARTNRGDSSGTEAASGGGSSQELDSACEMPGLPPDSPSTLLDPQPPLAGEGVDALQAAAQDEPEPAEEAVAPPASPPSA